MRVVFMGTPDFAVPIFRSLAASDAVVAVYTQPDAVSKRGRRLVPPPVKVAAEEMGLPVLQPKTLRDPKEVQRLRSFDPDIVCVAAYGQILPPDILAIPRHGCVNVHASLLPAYRGAAPVHRAVLDGEDVTGVSIMLMEEGLDTGPYAKQCPVEVDEKTVPELTMILSELGAEALDDVLRSIEDGSVTWTEQDGSRATYAAKITREDTVLDPSQTAEEGLRRIRVSTSQAPARLCIADTVTTVVRASRSDADVAEGSVVASTRALIIGFADGAVSLDRIRPAGKGDMDGGAWVCGARLAPECRWSRA